MTPLRPDLGHPLPSGATIEQIAAALGEVTTARVSYHGLLGGFGRDIPVHGGGVADLSRNISSANLVIKNRPIEQLDVGGDTFRKLTTDEQQKTGKLWRWVCHCPYGDDDLWAQIVAAMPQCAWLAGDGAEAMNDEPVHRYSFLISPGRYKTVPAMALLYAHLRSHRLDGLTLHVWLVGDATVRKIRLNYSPQRGRVRSQMTEYVDFGIPVDLAAPRSDQVTGKPRRRRTHQRAGQSVSS